MDRAFSSGSAGTPPDAPASPSIGYPTAGNPSTATAATKPGAYWYHMVTEELLAIIIAAGITPAQGTLTQLASAIQSGKLFSSVAGGTADALTAGFVPAVASLINGMSLYVRAGSVNATTTPTFTPASGTVAAKTIVKGNGLALAVGDIAGGGHWLLLQYDLALDKWVLLNPAMGVIAGFTQAQADARYTGIGYMLVQDQKSNGTNGGTGSTGINTRTLNTVVSNTISGASLASNQITLPAGTYRVKARAPVGPVDGNQAIFFNVTDTTSYFGSSNDGLSNVQSWSFVECRFNIASAKVFELRHWINGATTAALGLAAGAGNTEVYSQVEVVKES